MRINTITVASLAWTAHASHVVKVYEGSELGYSISVHTTNLSEPYFLSLNPRTSDSYLYNARDCPPFVKCLSHEAGASPHELYDIFANDDVETCPLDSIHLGQVGFARTSYRGSLLETAGSLGIGPRSEIANHFGVKFSSVNRSSVSFIPNSEFPDVIDSSSIELPIEGASGMYAMPLGSRIEFALTPGVVYSTPADLQIVFDPTMNHSLFPISVLVDIMNSLDPSFRGEWGPIGTGQLIIPSHLGIRGGFSLSLSGNETSIPLTDGIDRETGHLSSPSLRGSSAVLTNYKFVPEAKFVMIGGSILKNHIGSIILAKDRILIEKLDEPVLSSPTPVVHRLPKHPEFAGLIRWISSAEPAERQSMFSLRPLINSEYVLQSKYNLHTSVPVSMSINGTRGIGYILECIEFNDFNYRGPKIEDYSVLVQIDPQSNGGVVTWDLETGHVSLPLVPVDSNDSGQVYKVKTIKTPKNIFIMLIPHVVEGEPEP